MKERFAILLSVLITTLILGLGLTWVALAQGNPHGDYSDVTNACAACHRVHTGAGARLLYSSAQDNAFCYTCHNGTGAPALPVVSTHANSDFPGRSEAPFAALSCIQCHDPHGSGSNLYAIRERVLISPTLGTTGLVVFTAITGTNSYDDGSGSGICVVCHDNSDNPGYPMTSHVGANHVGGNDFTGQDCITCHPHSADDDRDTLDGFMPVDGCTICHSGPQDDGDGTPPGGRRAVTSDFQNTSHHVQGQVQDSDCQVCHYTQDHQSGQIMLYDVDNPATVIVLTGDPATNPTEAVRLEPFCLACHDGDGAGGLAPFSDNLMPTAIDIPAWNVASHGNSATCYDCHSNGHGSVKVNLLAPWNATPDGSLPGDPLREEEGLCYICHDADGPATTDVQTQFELTTRHNVSAADPDGEFVECVDCHNPHMVNATDQTSDPDDTNVLWTGTDEAFCLTCHDGAPPANVSFPPTSSGTGYDKSIYIGTTHAASLGGYSCRHCHDQHASDNLSLLAEQYIIADYNPWQSGDGDYAICWRCHDENTIMNQNNAFAGLHDRHVDREQSPCIICHEAHAPYDSGEDGLINFEFAVQNGYDIQYIDGYDASTSFWIETWQDRGNCYIRCHGENHNRNRYRYSRTDIVTVDCTACHP